MDERPAGRFEIEEDLVGGCAYDAHGEAISDADMAQGAWPPTRCCSARSAGRNGMGCPMRCGPKRGCCGCARTSELFANLRPGDLLSGAGRRLVAEARGGRGARHPDRARADRRRLFRRAEGDHRLSATARSAPSTRRSTTPSRSSASRASPSTWRARGATRCTSMEKRNVMKSGVLWNEVVTQMHKRELPRRGARAHAGRRRRHAAGARAEAVRRDRHRQSVRRHAVRRGGDADRLARHAAVGLARRAPMRRPASARRSTSRCTARRRTSPARASPTRSP